MGTSRLLLGTRNCQGGEERSVAVGTLSGRVAVFDDVGGTAAKDHDV